MTLSAIELTPLELTFLLQLLGCVPDYRTPIAALQLTTKAATMARDRTCLSLSQKGLVDYTWAVQSFAITPAGRTLLNLDTSILPVTPAELEVLRACRSQAVSPDNLPTKVPTADRQWLIQGLSERGLLTVKKRQLQAVWLTASGQIFLRDHYQPMGHILVATATQLNHYVQFLRRTLKQSAATILDDP